MKRLLIYTIFLLGFINIPRLNAATYTHSLLYRNDDNSNDAVLEATVVFNDGASIAQDNTTGVPGDDIDTNFTPSITYSYTPVVGGTTYTIDTTDFTFFNMTKTVATIDYDGDPSSYSYSSDS